MTSDDKVTYFGETDSRNKRIKFGIKAEDRTRHIYVIGKTGMGKSTLLENMAVQDIQGGEGLCFIDPHGKTAELLLKYIPENRVKDVLYFAPFDIEHPIAFNVMEDVGYDKRHLVVSGLMSTFKKIWVDAWSARMEYILSNTLLALLEYPGATLLGVNKMLSDKVYRKKVVDNITDPSVKSFWVDEFAKYTEKFAAEATPAIQNKIGQFTNNPLIRNIIGQPKSSFDLRKMMDERKILIVNLSKGRVGETNANLLGAMLITKVYLAAMSRADASEKMMKTLPNFYLYVDEFQSFANESFADILSEARKYKLNLTMAHQYIEQMSEEVRAAVFGNVGTMIVFRVGAYDAEVLEKEFAPQFTAEDIVNLGQFQLYLRLMIDGVGSQPFSARSLPPIAEPAVSFKEQAIQSSRAQFGQLRATVEEQVKIQTLGEAAVAAEKTIASGVVHGTAPIWGMTRPPQTSSAPMPRREDRRDDRRDDRRPDRAPERRDDRRDDRRNDRRESDRLPMNRPQNSVSVPRSNQNPISTSTPVPTSTSASASMPSPAPAPRRERQAPPPDPEGGFHNFDALKGLVVPAKPAAPQSTPRREERKGVTEESRNDLRQALASITTIPAQPAKPATPPTTTTTPTPVSTPSPKPEPNQTPKPTPAQPIANQPIASQSIASQPTSSPKEVPEDVLKKVLDM